MDWLLRHLDDWRTWGGGVIVSGLTFMAGLRKQRRDELRDLVDDLRAECERHISEKHYATEENQQLAATIARLEEVAYRLREISSREKLVNIMHATVRKETILDLRRALRAVHVNAPHCEEYIKGAVERLEQDIVIPEVKE